VLAVRAHASGISVYNVSAPASPVLTGSADTGLGGVSSVGVGVRMNAAGTLAVRSHPTGIDVYSISTTGAPTLVGHAQSTTATAVTTSVALDATATMAVRSHPLGIEVFDLTTPSVPSLRAQATSPAQPSTTGTAVVIIGTTGFRAHNQGLEAYNIAALPIQAPQSISATASAIGVGLTGL
jgi:hypothetical protein